jgi:hypothetical protein
VGAEPRDAGDHVACADGQDPAEQRSDVRDVGHRDGQEVLDRAGGDDEGRQFAARRAVQERHLGPGQHQARFEVALHGVAGVEERRANGTRPADGVVRLTGAQGALGDPLRLPTR